MYWSIGPSYPAARTSSAEPVAHDADAVGSSQRPLGDPVGVRARARCGAGPRRGGSRCASRRAPRSAAAVAATSGGHRATPLRRTPRTGSGTRWRRWAASRGARAPPPDPRRRRGQLPTGAGRRRGSATACAPAGRRSPAGRPTHTTYELTWRPLIAYFCSSSSVGGAGMSVLPRNTARGGGSVSSMNSASSWSTHAVERPLATARAGALAQMRRATPVGRQPVEGRGERSALPVDEERVDAVGQHLAETVVRQS